MNISERFIDKPIMTTLVVVVIVAFGAACYFMLPISSLPSVDYPVIQISAYSPGASPATSTWTEWARSGQAAVMPRTAMRVKPGSSATSQATGTEPAGMPQSLAKGSGARRVQMTNPSGLGSPLATPRVNR